MVYQNLLKERYQSELNKISLLQYVILNFKTVEINFLKLNPIDEKISYTNIPLFNQLPKLPAIYYYEILNTNTTVIWDALNVLKQKKSCSCPKLPKENRELNTRILYVGSDTKSLARRTMEHLGYGHRHTYALQLRKWAIDLKLHLVLNYSVIDTEFVPAMRHIEAAIGSHLDPLVGKREQ